MKHLEAFEKKNLKKNHPSFKVGDTLKVHTKIKEGDKERIQIYEGVVMRYTKGDIRTAITVRKVSFGVGVERVFPLHAPIVEKIEKVSEGKVRRGRLYYLRALKGKAARIESQWTEEAVETLGTVAAGPVISSTEEEPEKKTSAALDAAEYQKH